MEATLPSGEKISLTGFFTVDRPRLTTLSSEAIVDLVRSGAYELICHHLASLRNFNVLRDRTSEALQPPTDRNQSEPAWTMAG